MIRKSNKRSQFIRRVDTRTLLIIAALVVCIAAVYWQMIDHEFVTYDDNVYIFENRMVQSGLNWNSLVWAFTSGTQANWHPLTWLSIIVDYELFGLNAGWHHLMSAILHAINTVLVFFVFRKMTGTFWPSTFIAAFFGLHPLHVESVAWAAERKDVLSAFFWLLTILVYVRYVRRPHFKRYALVILFFALGLMAKPMLVTLPLLLLLLDYWPLGRIQFRKRNPLSKDPATISLANGDDRGTSLSKLLMEKVPLLGLSAVSSIVTFQVQRHGGAVFSLEIMPVTVRLENAVVSYVIYMRKMIWPSDLAVFYPHPGHGLPVWESVAAAALLLAMTALFLWLAREHRYLATGWLWYMGTLVPVIGIVQVGIQALADRYTYVPLIGLTIIIAWGSQELVKNWRFKGPLLASLSGVSLLVFTTLTWFQVATWHDSISLFSHAVEVTKRNYLALSNLGLGKMNKDRPDEAITHLTEALEIAPLIPDIHNYLGMAFARKGKVAEAIVQYREAVRLKPDHQAGNFNLAVALNRQGNTEEAITHFEEALRLNPYDAEAHNNLGAAYGKEGKMEEAIDHFREAVRLRPEYMSALYNLGTGLISQGKHEEAITPLSEVVRLKPSHANARYNLGLAFENGGKFSEALTQYEEAARIDPTNTQARQSWMRMIFLQRNVQEQPATN